MSTPPVLYSFRRCPYAIRTRMTLTYCDIAVEHREVLLKDKPSQMLAASAKGTVPVLVLNDGQVIDESLDIMHWALEQSDNQGWRELDPPTLARTDALVHAAEEVFKPNLDKYKYGHRGSDALLAHRDECVNFLEPLNQQLENGKFLFGERLTFGDVALFPFIRQFAHVDMPWFESLPLKPLQAWLAHHLQSTLFTSVMQKHPLWQADTDH